MFLLLKWPDFFFVIVVARCRCRARAPSFRESTVYGFTLHSMRRWIQQHLYPAHSPAYRTQGIFFFLYLTMRSGHHDNRQSKTMKAIARQKVNAFINANLQFLVFPNDDGRTLCIRRTIRHKEQGQSIFLSNIVVVYRFMGGETISWVVSVFLNERSESPASMRQCVAT